MKIKIEFTAEIIEDIGDVPLNKIYTAEQNKKITIDALKELCTEDAEITVSNFKQTNIT